MRAAALVGLVAVSGCERSDEHASLSYRALPAQPVGEHPVTLALLDADGDGDLDVAVPALAAANLTILYNQAGVLAPGPLIALDSGAGSAAVADLDGDGIGELLLGMAGAGMVARMQLGGDDHGTVDTWWPVEDAGPLAVGHLDDDDAVDVVVVQATEGRTVTLRGDGTGQLVPGPILPAPAATSSVCIDDIDGDGHADIAMTGGMSDEMWLHTSGRLDRVEAGRWPMGLAVAPLDSDPQLELVFAANQGDTLFIADPHPDGDGLALQELALPGQPAAVAPGDLDSDGTIDLVVAAKGGDRIDILHGAGDGSFTTSGSLATGWGPSAVAVADLDADQCPDIVVVNAFSNDVSTYMCVPDR